MSAWADTRPNDSVVPPEHVEDFQNGMKYAKADPQMVIYGGAVYGCTHKNRDW